ncbi:MAG: sterol desaturase family protein [Rudaea sp.]
MHIVRPLHVLRAIARLSTTRMNSRIGLALDSTVACALLYAGLRRHEGDPITAIAIILSGLVLFSLVEYCFHRWLFHGSAQGMLEQGHRRHHQNPSGYDSLPFFLPPLGTLALAALFATILPAPFALLLSGGLAAGYAFYGLSHCAIHGIRFRNQAARRWAANHHIHHHHPDRNFGVTTPLWDILLRTRYEAKKPNGNGSDRETTRTAIE